ncbi:protein FAR-RED IMPAIRED RESPONSE 1-like [Carya illinoinensis]|uniref:protein FAR-RED IMPAIRED RESPONSE 1-like n=1 Tax=Carya illinoinensis TaxID=32201 RepID=UPI001C71A5FF|nr:protein FAR-RED IMPAIRED RESPONSE 1-like [Carya illinoinensis]
MDGVIATYSVDNEVNAEDFIKDVTYTVLFNETKCLCRLFEMRGIICRHILSIFSARKVHELPEKYILDRYRNDIKRKYTLIPSNYDVIDLRPETVRYKCLLKIFYEVITNTCTQDGHTEDMVSKLYAMNEVYCTSKPHNIDFNVGVSTVNVATKGSSKKRRRLDSELLESTGNQLDGNQENVQTPVMVDQESAQQEVMGTQESIQLRIDGTQPETTDGMQPNNIL